VLSILLLAVLSKLMLTPVLLVPLPGGGKLLMQEPLMYAQIVELASLLMLVVMDVLIVLLLIVANVLVLLYAQNVVLENTPLLVLVPLVLPAQF